MGRLLDGLFGGSSGAGDQQPSSPRPQEQQHQQQLPPPPPVPPSSPRGGPTGPVSLSHTGVRVLRRRFHDLQALTDR